MGTLPKAHGNIRYEKLHKNFQKVIYPNKLTSVCICLPAYLFMWQKDKGGEKERVFLFVDSLPKMPTAARVGLELKL